VRGPSRAGVALVVLASMSLAAMGGCGAPPRKAATAPRARGSLTIALVGRPASIDPLKVSDASGLALDSLCYDGLVRVGPDMTAEPDLARSWRISPDHLTYTFHLDPRARWQDGRPVTSQDVAFSLHAYMSPGNAAPAAAELTDVAAVRTPNPRTVVVALRRPFAPFLLEGAALPVLPAHLLLAAGGGLSASAAALLSAHPVGSGPFRLAALSAQGARLEPNPGYFLGRPRLASLRVVFSPTAAAALGSLRRGEVDLAPVPGLDAPAVATWPGVHLRRTAALQFAAIVYNVKYGPLASPAVRRALYFAVDRGRIVQAALGGYGAVADGPIPPSSWAYDAALGHRAYDPARALAILSSLGWHETHGVLRDPQGRPLRLTILADAAVPSRSVTVGLAVRGLEAIGVQVAVRDEPFARYAEDFASGDFEAAFVERGLTPDPDVAAYFGSSAVNTSGQNAGFYADKAVDAALAAEREATGTAARRRAFAALQAALATDPPALFLYFPDDVYAVGPSFGGFTPDPAGIFWNSQDWRGQVHAHGTGKES